MEHKVHPELRQSYTLPSRLYTDEAALKIEQEKIFEKSWLFAGHVSQVKHNGDFFTKDIAGHSILIAKGNDGIIRAFYNVCTHRASKLEERECGNKKMLQCPYHAWTFTLDGHLNRAPNMKGLQFDAEDFCLKQPKLEIVASFIYINLDENASSMSEVFGNLFDGLKDYPLEELKIARVQEDIVKCNWKVTVDNYLECDHCPTIHKGFVNTLDMDNYEISTFDNYSYQGVPLRSGTNEPDKLGQSAKYYFLYPNMWISVNPGLPNVSINQSIPIDHETTKLIYTTYFLDLNDLDAQKKFYAFLDQVREEDFVICETVQKGLQSKGYTQGRFSLTENCVHHFHLLVQHALESEQAYVPLTLGVK
ncbi:aromatic ring-hydroxylating dioxygenase subunit alpha [Gottfriedia acidiceleris]|uniref:aromatic ring-hydroxylating oxygenase subunit alpha n=1 Tax=Gottfriedia acidiceleris TaxID=371036 RepID=UPI002FFFD8D5